MLDELKDCLWKNFAASIDMLSNAIEFCSDEQWNSNKKFFYISYHCAVFLDYYLTIPPYKFSSPLPYTLTEAENIPPDAVDDVVPDKHYSKKDLIDYIQYSREKLRKLIKGLTEENINSKWLVNSNDLNLDLASSSSMELSILGILFYNLRHTQHHAAQLNLLLRQSIDSAPDYVSAAIDDL
ncbi:MAG: hypothetical protein C5B52_11135 [Bacteroidetes bacterium]|nr:MAG: hypothetical protein C5B52_11135 [Bacteroidota bacterium]